MKIINLKNLSKKSYRRLITRSLTDKTMWEKVIPVIKQMISQIEKQGDKTIIKLHRQRYGNTARRSFLVSQKEISQAVKKADKSFVQALRQMRKNIFQVHQAQLGRPKKPAVKPEKGIKVWRVWRPIEKIGIYVPAGKAVYPSSLLMSAIPAQIAGCKQIIACCPPTKSGKAPTEILIAANMVGIKQIFCLNGVAAIAAMAYGTETVPKVDKIIGAAGAQVTVAKMAVFESGAVAIDMPAGPSEVFIIADDTANPAWIAADLLADGEHGFDSACVLVTTSRRLAKQTAWEINKQLSDLPTADRVRTSLNRYGVLAVADSLGSAVAFANDYAPEHLTIMTKQPEKLIPQITNAGSVYLGPWTTKSAGDYATGANHILPTGGMAKMYQPLAVETFGKWITVQKCSRAGLLAIRQTVKTLSQVEQLPAHQNSTAIRFRP